MQHALKLGTHSSLTFCPRGELERGRPKSREWLGIPPTSGGCTSINLSARTCSGGAAKGKDRTDRTVARDCPFCVHCARGKVYYAGSMKGIRADLSFRSTRYRCFKIFVVAWQSRVKIAITILRLHIKYGAVLFVLGEIEGTGPGRGFRRNKVLF